MSPIARNETVQERTRAQDSLGDKINPKDKLGRNQKEEGAAEYPVVSGYDIYPKVRSISTSVLLRSRGMVIP